MICKAEKLHSRTIHFYLFIFIFIYLSCYLYLDVKEIRPRGHASSMILAVMLCCLGWLVEDAGPSALAECFRQAGS